MKKKIVTRRQLFLPPELPKSRKTASASLDVNLQSEEAAGCSAYHLHVQAERSSRTAGCSAYPTDPFDLVEIKKTVKQSCNYKVDMESFLSLMESRQFCSST